MPFPVTIPPGAGASLPAAANAIAPFIRAGAAAPPLPLPLPAAAAPAVPLLGRSGAGLGLLLAFGGGYALGTWLWDLYNGRGYRDQEAPPLDPTKPGRQEGTGEYSLTAATTYRVTGTVTRRNANTGQIESGVPVNALTIVQPADSAWNPGYLSFEAPQVRDGFSGWQQCFIRAKGGIVALTVVQTGGLFNSPRLTLTATTSGADRLPMPGNVPLPPTDPDPNWQPQPLPEIVPVPAVPETRPLPVPSPAPPQPAPEPLPEWQPVPIAPTRPPVAPPAIAPGSRPGAVPRPRPLPPPVPDTGRPTRPDGTPQPEPVPPPTTRPPGVETVPGGEIGQPGTQPRPDLPGIAAEVGKLEQKLRLVLEAPGGGGGGGEPDPRVDEILAILRAPYGAGGYQLFPACETDADGRPRPPMETEWPAGVGAFERLQARLDGLADLIQFGKELRQPVCNRAPIGEEVTVNFIEDLETSTRRRPLTKRLTYRDRTGRSAEWHAAYWEGFAWDAGPAIVAANGPWGCVKCWAASEGEGKRVLRHALTAGGWDPDSEPGTEWIATRDTGGRNGQPGRMVLWVTREGFRVSKRRGSSGSPDLPDAF